MPFLGVGQSDGLTLITLQISCLPRKGASSAAPFPCCELESIKDCEALSAM